MRWRGRFSRREAGCERGGEGTGNERKGRKEPFFLFRDRSRAPLVADEARRRLAEARSGAVIA